VLTVSYRSESGAGTFPCYRRADGTLDDIATFNHKLDIYWANPETAPRF
jgi:hypothetical protein